MIYWRCKCGASTGFGSDLPPACDTCDECHSTMSTHPLYHPAPIPHDLQTRYDEITGEPYKRCHRCLKKVKDADIGIEGGVVDGL